MNVNGLGTRGKFVLPHKVPFMKRPPDGGRMRGNMESHRKMQRSQYELQRKKRNEKRIRARKRKRVLFLWRLVTALLCLLLLWDISLRLEETLAEREGRKTEASFPADTAWERTDEEKTDEEKPDEIAAANYLEQFQGIKVEAPVKRTEREVRLKVEELGEEYPVIGDILESYEAYPYHMMEALANNPEMADFVSGYFTAPKEAQGGLTQQEKEERFPLFLQWDQRWGYVPYGDDSNIGLAGCEPTCLSMALYALTRNEELTPDVLAAYSMENGYYMKGTGTAWALMEDVPPRYGVSVSHPRISEASFKRELDEGHVIICAMRPGDFTAGGHFIVLYGYDETGFFVNDPNCVARSSRTWSYEEIVGQIKQLWSLRV